MSGSFRLLPMASLARAVLALVLGAAVATCVDGGPTASAGRRVAVSVAPSFAIGGDDPVIAIARLVAIVQRHPSLEVVFQTSVTVTPGQSEVAMSLTVPLVAFDDRYRLIIAGLSAAGDTVYRAMRDSVNLTPQGVQGPPIEMPLRYAGPDTLVAAVSIAPRDTVLRVGDEIQLRGTAVTAAGAAMPAQLRFGSRDQARVAVTSSGALRAVAEVQGAWVVVATANSLSDSTRVTVVPLRALTRIDAGPDRAMTSLGDTVMLPARALDQDGVVMPGIALSFASTNPEVATVSAGGVVTAAGAGSALIVVGAAAVRDTVAISVSQVAASVQVAPDSGTLDALGAELSLAATARDAKGNGIPLAQLEWSSLETSVASVTAAGVVRAAGNGSARIVARSGAAADTVVVRVAQRIASVVITPAGPVAIATGDTVPLAATAFDAGGSAVAGAAATWSTTNAGVASVSAAAQLVAHAAGSAMVVATAGDATDTLVVTVTQEAASVRITPADSTTLTALDATEALVATVSDRVGVPIAGATVTWSSSAPGVATVSAAGELRAVSTGRAEIIARFGALADTLAVGVLQDPAAIVAAPDSVMLTAIGDGAAFAAQVQDRNGRAIPGAVVTWTSLDPAIASVSASGAASTLAAGRARIVAASGLLRDTVVVVVTQVPATTTISPRGGTLTAFSELLPLSVTVRDRNGFAIASPSVAWTSASASVADVTALGVVRATGNGGAYIRAVAGAARDSVAVTVSQAVASITLSGDTVRLANTGDTATVLVTPRDRNGFAATNHLPAYTTSDGAVASVAPVSGGARVTLTGAGVATITATAGGSTATFEVIKTPAEVPIDARYAWIRVTPATASARVGDTLVLVADMMDAQGNPTRIVPQWATDKPGRASVSAAGVVVVLDTGAVTITATSNGVAGHSRLQLFPAPVLRQFTFAPRTLYGSATSAVRFSVSMEVNDAGAGVGGVQVTFTAPNGVTQSCAAAAPTSGSRTAGWWDCVVTLPAGSPTGTWRVTRLELTGSIVRIYEEASLARYGGTTLTVNP